MPVTTATVTWITHKNFGTSLQAYALQHVLKEAGYANKVLDDASVIASFAKKRFSIMRLLKGCGWLYPKKAAYRRQYEQSVREFDSFKERFIEMDSEWTSREDLSDRYDVFIAGSDQIWSPNVPFDDYYYLAFAGGKKVAYAPSFGASVFTEKYIKTVLPLISDFDAVSVREPSAALMLKESLGLDVQVVADPTMLIDASGWNSLLEEGGNYAEDVSERYALCYFLSYNKRYVDYVKAYCAQKGLKLKSLVANEDMVGRSDEDIYAGPLSFIRSIKGAEVVFTDSYHGTIFSVLYQKDLLVFRRFLSTSPLNQNSRLEHLMHRLGLDGRLAGEGVLTDSWQDTEIDYSKVNGIVEEFRSHSLGVLKSMLKQ